ncbi:MAG: hypothetical protein IJX66_01200 [Lachnospiraceae bacterium]|nr:hypothetical protein [Lachnospiraceae bacterium]
MVEYILGNYLVETGKITGGQLEQVIAKLDQVRVKMGLLAVAEGIMTIEQADEVNRLQATMDKRFGDIAVEKGYLTEEQISNLLKKQGNTYLAFAQALVNEELLQLQELEEVMDNFQEKNGFTKSEMEDLRSDEPERIVPLFLPPEALGYKEIVGVLVRTLIRCVDRHVYIGKAALTDEISVKESAFQKIVGFSAPVAGCTGIETGLAEEEGGLDLIATAFCREEGPLEKEDMLDAAGEFLNCVNGLYATSLSRAGIDSELIPPIYFEGASTLRAEQVCSLPVYAGGKKAVFVIMGLK